MGLKEKGAVGEKGEGVAASGGGAHDDDDHGGEPGHRSKDEDEEALARAEELKKSAEAKRLLRQANLAPDRPDASFFKSLDSSIKRNTAVIKKLKQINEEQKEGLLEELRVVNLSKFVSEAVTAILDAKLRSSDINAAVQVCSLLHQRYKDFAPTLLAGLMKIFFPAKGDEIDGDRGLRAMKKRSTLRLLMELYFCGVFEDGSVFVSIVKDLASSEHLRDREATQTNLSLLVSFARQGRGLLGLSLNGQDGHEEVYKELSMTTDQKKLLLKLFQSFLDAVVDLLQTEHGALRQLELENARMLNAKGELSEENAAAYEKLRKSYEHLFRNISSLAEAMDTQPPVMPEDGHTTRVTSGDDGASQTAGKELASPEPIWDDEDTRSFYESLPDLRAFVPAVLLGEAEPKGVAEASQKAAEHVEPEQTVGPAPETSDVILETETQASEIPTALDDKSTFVAAEKPKDKDKDDKDKNRDPEKDKMKEKEKEGEKKLDKETEKVKGAEGASLDSLLQRLPGCVSRDLIDQLTVDFCYLNSKSSRKKLVRTLFNVPRSSLELIPYYSRMIATLSTCMKDVAPMILQLLEEEFNFLMNKKDQMNIETKIRNIRFLGELAKFKVASAGLVFSCLKSCLDDFTHHNIDVACNLLETCGRFLYRFPETSLRMGNMLEIIMRLKNVKNLDARHSTLVENAYYQCKPPERSARVSKVRPPLHQYIRKLLFADLDKTTIERVLRQLRKLPWSECETYLLKCFMKVYKGKYSQVHLIASLTAGLSRYHDAFAVAVVDEVLEAIRVGLELNEYGMQQRRIAYMRFLGELYSYRLIDSPVIFDTLYLIIGYGHGTSEQDVLDPPEDCFRLRMVITLLDACGQFFDRGSSKRRLDRFLLYFQRYVLSKGVIPLDVEFDLQDLFANLRPKMVRYATYDEANQALLELEEVDRSLAASEKERNSRPSNTTTQADGEVHANNLGSEYGKDTQNSGAAPHGTRAAGVHGTGLVDDGDSESETESGSMEADGQEEEEELEEDKYPDHDDEGDDELEVEELEGGVDTAGSEEEEKVKVMQKKMPESDPAEEAEFDREYRALMQESIDSRKLEMRSRPTLNMTIPLNLFDSKDHGRGGGTDIESGDEVVDDQTSGTSVQFRVLVKKGNKQQTKQLRIPRDCSLVQSTKQKEAAELEEKQDIKRLVLEYNERDEEDRAGTAPQPMNWATHQGAPGLGRGRGGHWGEGGGRVGNAARQRRPIAAGGYGRRR